MIHWATLKIEQLFTILKDGTWHDIVELAEQINIQPDKLIELSKFLLQKGIIKYEAETRKIQIEPEWRRLIPNENELKPHKRRTLKS